MSFLRTKYRSNKIQNILPSPTNKKVVSDQKSRKKSTIPLCSVRGTSLFASFFQKRMVHGGMTVEASLVLPLFLFFFLHLMGSVEMIRLHGKLTLSLWDVGKQLMVYGAVADTVGLDLPDVGVSYLFVQNNMVNLLGSEYLDSSPLVYGKNGLNYLASEYDSETVDIQVTYQVRPKVTIFPFDYMRMVNRFLGKSWTGFDVSAEVPKYVYITLYGEVWHVTPDCSHILINVYSTSKGEIGALRNEHGGRYSLCELCEDREEHTVVYYTPQGDRYHRVRTCCALTRYVRAIVWQKNMSHRPCSRCVKEGFE